MKIGYSVSRFYYRYLAVGKALEWSRFPTELKSARNKFIRKRWTEAVVLYQFFTKMAAEPVATWTVEQLNADDSISKKQIVEFLHANASSDVKTLINFL